MIHNRPRFWPVFSDFGIFQDLHNRSWNRLEPVRTGVDGSVLIGHFWFNSSSVFDSTTWLWITNSECTPSKIHSELRLSSDQLSWILAPESTQTPRSPEWSPSAPSRGGGHWRHWQGLIYIYNHCVWHYFKKSQKNVKNAEKSHDSGHIKMVKPNKAKLEIFAKYFFRCFM